METKETVFASPSKNTVDRKEEKKTKRKAISKLFALHANGISDLYYGY